MDKNKQMISDELLAAYLDGAVSAQEKAIVESRLVADDELIEVIDIMSDLGLNKQNISRQPVMKKNNSFKVSPGLSAAAAFSASKLVQMYQKGSLNFSRPAAASLEVTHIPDNDTEIGFAHADTTHGKPELDVRFDPNTYQYYSDSCAFQSQSIILKEYGIDVSQEELMELAKSQGWYVEGHGTPLEKVGKLLEHYDVPTTFTEGNNIFNLTNELAQGHRIIVTVDSGELWHDGVLQDLKDVVLGSTPNHALVVVGVDTSNPDDVKVIVTDPGNGNLQRAYSEKQFVDAWKDSNCFMAATEVSPDQFLNDMPASHLDEFADMPYSSIERLAEAHLDSSADDFEAFVTEVFAHPDGIDTIIEQYPDLFENDQDGYEDVSDDIDY